MSSDDRCVGKMARKCFGATIREMREKVRPTLQFGKFVKLEVLFFNESVPLERRC
jgi:hypothetical protein